MARVDLGIDDPAARSYACGMIPGSSSRITLVLCLASSLVLGREWRSVDAKRSFEAVFVALRGDQLLLAPPHAKPSPYPLAAFSKEDQQFAQNAQMIAEAAEKMGPQSFEISQIADDGWICRMALPGAAKSGPAVFGGELFFLIPADPSQGSRGMQIANQRLYGAGGRTFHPIKGAPSPIRAFCLNAEDAARIWMETVGSANADPAKQSPAVIEPEIQIITQRGMGLALTREGLVLVGSQMAKDATSLAVHLDGKDEPATLLKTDDKLGVALISCSAGLQPGRFGARKPVELGQSVFAVSMELSTAKKSIGPPAITRGIVSRLQGNGRQTFQHDAMVPAESVGGYVVSDKGDVLGLFLPPVSVAGRAKQTSSTTPRSGDLPACIRTDALSEFLKETAGAGALRVLPGGMELTEIAQTLRESSILVVATREIRKTRTLAPARSAVPTAGGPTGYSLSQQGVRHTSTCKFYSPNRPCAATDGRACKICGG